MKSLYHIHPLYYFSVLLNFLEFSIFLTIKQTFPHSLPKNSKFQLAIHQRIANSQLSHSLHWFHLRNYISDLTNYQFFLHENQFNFQFFQAISGHHSIIDSWYSNFTSILTPLTSTVKALTGLAVLIISSSEAMTDANQQ